MLRKLWQTRWKGILTFLVWVIVLLAAHIPRIADAMGKGTEFWCQLWSLEVALGALVMVLMVALPAGMLLWFVWHLAKGYPFQLSISWAQLRALQNIRRQQNLAIRVARPEGFRDRTCWYRLAAAATEGFSEDDVIEAHCEDGDKGRPIIFSNFQGYAHAVKRVLESLEGIRCRSPYPHVWTLFKRPIWDWYNPFSSGKTARDSDHFTVDWWEDYKSRFREIKNKGLNVRVFRLVAHADASSRLPHPSEIYLYGSTNGNLVPMTLAEARAYADSVRDVDWHPSITGLLSNSYHDDSEPERKVYLIGKPRDGTVPAQAHPKLLDHFETTYHHHFSSAGNNSRGCFVKYVQSVSDLQGLDIYDDVFIVSVSASRRFGMAFVDDESRDINGMRFLLDYELIRQSIDFHTGQRASIQNSFEEAWKVAMPEFRVCEGLL